MIKVSTLVQESYKQNNDMIKFDITEDKGSGKRYEMIVTKKVGFFQSLFGEKESSYKVRILSRQAIDKEKLENIANQLISKQEQWKKSSSKSCDFSMQLTDFPKANFYISSLNCDNDTTSKTTEE